MKDEEISKRLRVLMLALAADEPNASRSDRVIMEFAKQAVDNPNPCDAIDWIKARAKELGSTKTLDGMVDSISLYNFVTGFRLGLIHEAMHSWIAGKK